MTRAQEQQTNTYARGIERAPESSPAAGRGERLDPHARLAEELLAPLVLGRPFEVELARALPPTELQALRG